MKKGVDYIGVGCGAVILNENNQVLLMKRNSKCRNMAGFWSIPGGGVEHFETFNDALIRETKEEVGLDIKILKLLCLTDDIIPEENQHWVTPQFLCKVIGGELQNLEPHKCDELKWFSLDNLPKDLTKPTINGTNSIKDLLKNNNETI